MNDLSNIEMILDGIRNELLFIRKILEREENSKSMILQKVRDEEYNTKLF
jgi:hypothetical protein